MLKQAVEYAASQAAQAPPPPKKKPGPQVSKEDDRPRPFDPPRSSLKGHMLLAVRSHPGAGTQEVIEACWASYQAEQDANGEHPHQRACTSHEALRSVLRGLLRHPTKRDQEHWEHEKLPGGALGPWAPRILEWAPAYVAQQTPLETYGMGLESTWTPLETPWWKPGDGPRIVKPPTRSQWAKQVKR